MFLKSRLKRVFEFQRQYAPDVLCLFDLKTSTLKAICVALFCIIEGCAKPQESYLTVEVCVSDNQGVSQLRNIMKNAADSERLRFIDNSDEQVKRLTAMEADRPSRPNPNFVIDFHIEGPGGLGVTAGNLGLHPYQVALGFTAGSDRARAHRLSDLLIQSLSQRWHVQTVRQGEGVFPMTSCR